MIKEIILLVAMVNCQTRVSLSLVELFPALKTISIQTNYELKKDLPAGATIAFDFSKSNIGVPSGQLQLCQQLDLFNPAVQVNYVGCSCSGSVCQMVTTQLVRSGAIYWLRFGQITNPQFVRHQSVDLKITYDANFFSQLAITITQDIYQAGQLLLQEILQSSFKVGATSNITIKVQIQHPISADGKLSITLPQEVRFQANVSVVVNTYGAGNVTGVIEQSDQQLRVSGIFATQVQVIQGQNILIYMLNLVNPEAVSSSRSLIIDTTTASNHLIDRISSGVFVTATQPEDILINFVGVFPGQSTQINTMTVFYFNLQPMLKFLGGGCLEIVFPQEISINPQFVQCTKILGLAIFQGDSYSCTVTGQSIKTVNLQYPNQLNQLLITVSGAVNPNTIKPTSTFQFKTFDLNNNLIAIASLNNIFYTATPGTLTPLQLLRSTTTVSSETSIVIQMQTSNPIPSAGYIILQLPHYQALYDNTVALTCLGALDNNDLTPTSCSILASAGSTPISNGYTKIKVQQFCSDICPLTFLNPPFISNKPNSIIISTFSSNDYLIDTLGSDLILSPSLTPIQLSYTSFARSSSSPTQSYATVSELPVGTLAIIKIIFPMPSSYFRANDGNLVIYLPIAQYYLSPDSQLVCQQLDLANNPVDKVCEITEYVVQTPLDPKFNIVRQIRINSVCQLNLEQICTLGLESFTFLVFGLRTSLKSGTLNMADSQAVVRTYTLDDMDVSYGQQSSGTETLINTELKSTNGLVFDIAHMVTGLVSQYQIQFVMAQALDIYERQGRVEFVFPKQVQIDSNANCMSSIGKVTLECQCLWNSNTIVTYYRGGLLDPFQVIDQQMTVSVSQLRNPYSLSVSDSLLVNQYYGDVVSVQYTGAFQMNKARDLQASIIRINSTIQQSTVLRIEFSLENSIEDQGFRVELWLPKQEVVRDQFSMVDELSRVMAIQQSSSQSDYFVIAYRVLCPCQSQYRFELSGVKNPLQFEEQGYLSKIWIQNDLGHAYQAKDNIVITPELQQGRIYIISVQQMAVGANQKNTVQINYRAQSQMVSGRLVVSAQGQLMYRHKVEDPILNNGQLNSCTFQYHNQQLISITCNDFSTTPSLQESLVISNILTKPYLNDNTQCSISLSTTYDEGQLTFTHSLQPTTLNNVVLTRTNNQVNHSTSLTLIVDELWYLKVYLPTSEITVPSNYNDAYTITSNNTFTLIEFQMTQAGTVTLPNLINGPKELSIQPNTLIQYYKQPQFPYTYSTILQISPKLSCPTCQLTSPQFLTYTKDSWILLSQTNMNILAIAPTKVATMESFQLFDETIQLTDGSKCKINGIDVVCAQSSPKSITFNQFKCLTECETQNINITIENAINSPQVTTTLITTLHFSNDIIISKSFTYPPAKMTYSNTLWNNNYFYNNNLTLEFQIKLTNGLGASTQNNLLFNFIDPIKINLTNALVTINKTTITKQVKSNVLELLNIYEQGCPPSSTLVISITNMQVYNQQLNDFNKQFELYVTIDSIKFDSITITNSEFFPALLPNPIAITIPNVNYTDMNLVVNIGQPEDKINENSMIRLTFQNEFGGVCVINQLIDQNPLVIQNQTCVVSENTILKQVRITDASNVVTHVSNQQLEILFNIVECPQGSFQFADQCRTSCPKSGFFLDKEICKKCSARCSVCTNFTQCTTCLEGYELIGGLCEQIIQTCQTENCQQCYLANNVDEVCLKIVVPQKEENHNKTEKEGQNSSNSTTDPGQGTKSNTTETGTETETETEKEKEDNSTKNANQSSDQSSESPEFGPATIILIGIIVMLWIYLIVSILMQSNPRPLLGSLLMSMLVVVSICSTMSSVMLMMYSLFTLRQASLILSGLCFCLCNVQQIEKGSLLEVLCQGQGVKIGLTRLLGFRRGGQDSQVMSDYLLVGKAQGWSGVWIGLACMVADVIVIAVYSQQRSECCVLGGVKLCVDLLWTLLQVIEMRYILY